MFALFKNVRRYDDRSTTRRCVFCIDIKKFNSVNTLAQEWVYRKAPEGFA